MSEELEALNLIITRLNPSPDNVVKAMHEVKIVENALKEYELIKQTRIIVVDKKISDDDLEKLKNQRIFASGLEESKVELLFDEETQKKLKDFEWLKSKIDIDFVYRLPTDDRIKLIEILGVKL